MRGPVVVGVEGRELSATDRERLLHPRVGMVILFATNYESPEQLTRLCAQIHALRDPPLLIAVDHEGGRVQRFRQGFTVLPPMRRLGQLWDRDVLLAVVSRHRPAMCWHRVARTRVDLRSRRCSTSNMGAVADRRSRVSL
jgi:beta-glucosidase-like glycosyl hydrolase